MHLTCRRCTTIDNFFAVGLVFSSSRSKPWFPRYLEVLKSFFFFIYFQIRFTKYRRPLHHMLHSSRFYSPSASIHRQQLYHWINTCWNVNYTRHSVHLTCRRRVTLILLMLLSTNFLLLCRLLAMVWQPSMVYFGFFLFLCLLFLLLFLGFSVAHSPCLPMFWCLGRWNSIYITNHLYCWPRFLVSVPRTKWLVSSEACIRLLMLLGLYFRVAQPLLRFLFLDVNFFFFFFMNQ